MTTTYDAPVDLRKKLKRSKASSENWKAKLSESQYNLKIERSKARALRDNRDEWRQKCQDTDYAMARLQDRLKELQIANERLTEELQAQRTVKKTSLSP